MQERKPALSQGNEMEAKHTPGTWILGCEIGVDSTRIETESGKVIGAIRSREITSFEQSRPVYSWDDEGFANARLISAAPELLEVVQSILADDMLQYLPSEYVAKVRTVIAKATGA